VGSALFAGFIAGGHLTIGIVFAGLIVRASCSACTAVSRAQLEYRTRPHPIAGRHLDPDLNVILTSALTLSLQLSPQAFSQSILPESQPKSNYTRAPFTKRHRVRKGLPGAASQHIAGDNAGVRHTHV